MNLTQSSPITILLDRHAHKYAQQFASQQTTLQKGKQVYLNTLAVYAVHTYLQCFDITTNLAQSDCWHPGLRSIFNLADLVIFNLGKIECLWILPEEKVISIPPEVRANRLGYLVLQFTEDLTVVELLGFLSGDRINDKTETISITPLQPFEILFDTLESVRQQINLRQWLTGLFTSDWQPIETIMAGRVTRSININNDSEVISISCGKTVSWEINRTEITIILILQTTASNSETIDLCLQLYPSKESHNLPTGLSVNILDNVGVTCLSATAKDNDDWMQLEFSCDREETFNLELTLAGVSIIEKFQA